MATAIVTQALLDSFKENPELLKGYMNANSGVSTLKLGMTVNTPGTVTSNTIVKPPVTTPPVTSTTPPPTSSMSTPPPPETRFGFKPPVVQGVVGNAVSNLGANQTNGLLGGAMGGNVAVPPPLVRGDRGKGEGTINAPTTSLGGKVGSVVGTVGNILGQVFGGTSTGDFTGSTKHMPVVSSNSIIASATGKSGVSSGTKSGTPVPTVDANGKPIVPKTETSKTNPLGLPAGMSMDVTGRILRDNGNGTYSVMVDSTSGFLDTGKTYSNWVNPETGKVEIAPMSDQDVKMQEDWVFRGIKPKEITIEFMLLSNLDLTADKLKKQGYTYDDKKGVWVLSGYGGGSGGSGYGTGTYNMNGSSKGGWASSGGGGGVGSSKDVTLFSTPNEFYTFFNQGKLPDRMQKFNIDNLGIDYNYLREMGYVLIGDAWVRAGLGSGGSGGGSSGGGTSGGEDGQRNRPGTPVNRRVSTG